MFAQHLPSLPEDVPGKRVSLVCTWGREEKGAGECRKQPALATLPEVRQQAQAKVMSGWMPTLVSKPLPTIPGTSSPPPPVPVLAVGLESGELLSHIIVFVPKGPYLRRLLILLMTSTLSNVLCPASPSVVFLTSVQR